MDLTTVADISEEQLLRYWQKVEKTDDCWIWIGAKAGHGYGVFVFNGKSIGAHRLAWILAGNILAPSMMICHHCDNPGCVRPDHLFQGTQVDNMLDARLKGRTKGSEYMNPSHPPKTEFGHIVMLLIQRGFRETEIAARIGTTQPTINRIKRGVVKTPQYDIGRGLILLESQTRRRKEK